jgi:hypothetical protein
VFYVLTQMNADEMDKGRGSFRQDLRDEQDGGKSGILPARGSLGGGHRGDWATDGHGSTRIMTDGSRLLASSRQLARAHPDGERGQDARVTEKRPAQCARGAENRSPQRTRRRSVF